MGYMGLAPFCLLLAVNTGVRRIGMNESDMQPLFDCVVDGLPCSASFAFILVIDGNEILRIIDHKIIAAFVGYWRIFVINRFLIRAAVKYFLISLFLSGCEPLSVFGERDGTEKLNFRILLLPH